MVCACASAELVLSPRGGELCLRSSQRISTFNDLSKQVIFQIDEAVNDSIVRTLGIRQKTHTPQTRALPSLGIISIYITTL